MTTNDQRPGWVAVLDAFIAAPNRTLTNADLGAIIGVQAWHQRISDLKRYGYLITPSVKIAQGYYAYSLVGLAGSVSDDRPHADKLPRLAEKAAKAAILDATIKMQERKPPKRTTTGAPAAAGGPRRSPEPTLSGDADEFIADFIRWAADLGVDVGDGDDPGVVLERVSERVASWTPKPRKRTKAGKTAAPRRGTGPELIARVLREAGEPLHASIIVKRVLELDGARPKDQRAYKGKTPANTITAQLATAAKRDDGLVVRTAPNTFDLRVTDEGQ